MATTSAEIVNRSLNLIGNTAHIDTLEDATEEARTAKVEWEDCLKRALTDGEWKFATKRATLSPLAGVTARTNWVNQFTLPPDFLSLVKLIIEGTEFAPPDVRDEFDIESNDAGDGQVLLCNLDSVEVKYIFYQTNVRVFSAKFNEALTLLLASKLAAALPKDNKLAASLEGQYRAMVAEASAENRKQQELQKLEPATPSLRARGGTSALGSSD